MMRNIPYVLDLMRKNIVKLGPEYFSGSTKSLFGIALEK